VTGAVAVSILAVVTIALADWSRRYRRRTRGTPEANTAVGIKYGMLHVLLFPLAGVFAVVALVMVIDSLVDGSDSGADRDDGCASVDLALRWLSSDGSADREFGIVVATEVWDRAGTDDEYSIRLRRECPVEVMTMLDEAGLPFHP
jgi:hypothetical protein